MSRHASSLVVIVSVLMLAVSAGAASRAAASPHATAPAAHNAADIAFEALRILRVP